MESLSIAPWIIWTVIAVASFILEIFIPGFWVAILGIGALAAVPLAALEVGTTWLRSWCYFDWRRMVLLRPPKPTFRERTRLDWSGCGFVETKPSAPSAGVERPACGGS